MVSEIFGGRARLVLLYTLLAAANLLAWGWALLAFRHYPVLLGSAMLAYGFGLRHAVDADHISAIDNVTRKLIHQGKRPMAVGLWFSLGHSTVVFALSLAIAAGTAALKDRFAALHEVGSVIGTSVSALFLFAIAAANIAILATVFRSFRTIRRGGRLEDGDIDVLTAGGGLLSRLFRRLFRLIQRDWQMYPLGLLFGLGFDTATEVGLLGISASQASQGLPVWSILVFPALFTAGMALIDTLDSTLMVGAYDWALANPVRKLYYNMTITAVSVLAALLVGGVEALALLADKLALRGAFWRTVGRLNDNFGLLGILIVALFVLSWLVSVVVYRAKDYDAVRASA